MPGPKVLRFPKGLPVQPQYGERLRFKVLKGRQFKDAYCLMGDSIVLGRDDSCDIMLEDTRASRKHVSVNWQDEAYIAEDMGSVNGLLVNGKRVQTAELDPGDILVIGDTSIEVIEAGKTGDPKIAKLVDSDAKKKKENESIKKKRIIVLVGLIFLAYLALSNDERATELRRRATVQFVDDTHVRRKLRKAEAKALVEGFVAERIPETEQEKSAERFYRRGLRELKNHNYRRAITAFETALTIDNRHELAKIYLEMGKKQLANEVETTYKAAVRARKSFRYREARMHYKNVMSILAADPHHPKYVDAKESLEKLDKLEGHIAE